MERADEVKKLLDNGWIVRLFRNELGSYTAQAKKPKHKGPEAIINTVVTTDDFEPSDALYRLVEKATTGRVV